MRTRTLRFVLVCLVLTALTQPQMACGKRGKPKPTAEIPITYPKSYPTQ